jgi:hypothetical protein
MDVNYMGLSDEQQIIFDNLMKKPLNQWPKSLFEFAKSNANEVGFCGEVLAESVALWVKEFFDG